MKLEFEQTNIIEIGDLITNVSEYTKQSYNDCENQAFKEYVFPENTTTYIDLRWPEEDQSRNWFRRAVEDLKKLNNITKLTIQDTH